MACIGPYSQALRAGPLLLSAGVLGLVPHTMALPTAQEAAAAAAAEGCTAAAGPGPQWEAELWLLMRSLRNVLEVMGSGFGEARLAHVYVAGSECELREASERVLAYMRRDAPDAAPILAGARVPRLPKDGSVEVNVVCWGGGDDASGQAPAVSSTVHEVEAGPVAGSVSVTTWAGTGAHISVAEFVLADAPEQAGELSEEAVAHAVERCASAALSTAAAGAGLSLQVQCAVPAADGAAAAAAAGAADKLGLSDACAVSCMPVIALGPRVLVRSVVLAA